MKKSKLEHSDEINKIPKVFLIYRSGQQHFRTRFIQKIRMANHEYQESEIHFNSNSTDENRDQNKSDSHFILEIFCLAWDDTK